MAGTTNSHVKAILRQLDKGQLVKLARQRNAKQSILIKNKIGLVDWLSHIITKQEITELVSKHGRIGDKAVIDGMTFERKVMNKFAKIGFKCELNNVKIPHMEFDIIGYKKEGNFLSWEAWWLIAECKNKPKVTMGDLSKFFLKYEHFRKLKKEEPEYCLGYIVTSGFFDPPVKKLAKAHGIKLIPLR
jgi:hypothetical protein